MTARNGAAGAPILEVEGVARTFSSRGAVIHALRGVDLVIRDGEVVGLLGVNGAGKTTLLKIVSTLLLPTSGRVRVGGFDVVRQTDRARRLFSVVFGGDRGFYTRLSARDNIRYFAALSGLPYRETRRRCEAALEEFGLAEAADRPVETFSRGMRQRLHLAAGLVSRPRLLMLDEPTVGLDPIEADRFRAQVAALGRAGVTVLVTSHYLGDIERLASRVVILQHGVITHDLPLRRLLQRTGATAEVRITGRGGQGITGVLGRHEAGIRVVDAQVDTAGDVRSEDCVWTLTVEVESWTPDSLRALARLWPDGEVEDVRVQPVSLERVFVELTGRAEEPVHGA